VGNPYQIMFKVVNEELRPEIPAHCPLGNFVLLLLISHFSHSLALSRLITRCIMLNTQDRPTFKEIIGILQSADLNPETMLLGGTYVLSFFLSFFFFFVTSEALLIC
jgi:hypothetical protein